MIFSLRKGDDWFNFISSKDSIIMKLANPVSFSESESDKYHFDFLIEEAIIGVYFSLVPCSSTHRGVQLMLGMNQGGNAFALAETEIQYQYTHARSKIPNLCQIMGFHHSII